MNYQCFPIKPLYLAKIWCLKVVSQIQKCELEGQYGEIIDPTKISPLPNSPLLPTSEELIQVVIPRKTSNLKSVKYFKSSKVFRKYSSNVELLFLAGGIFLNDFFNFIFVIYYIRRIVNNKQSWGRSQDGGVSTAVDISSQKHIEL